MKDLDFSLNKNLFDAALMPDFRTATRDSYANLRTMEDLDTDLYLDVNGEFYSGTFTLRDCPLCYSGAQDHSDYMFTTRGMDIMSCQICNHGYSRQVLLTEFDELRYTESSNMKSHKANHELAVVAEYAELNKRKAQYVYAQVARYKSQPGSLLDIGCGSGVLLQAFYSAGWEVQGIEANLASCQQGRDLGLNITNGFFPKGFKSEAQFDVISMFDVLEHLEDPLDFLGHVILRLKPGGLIVIQVPNFNSLLIRLEGPKSSNYNHGHWSHFTPDSISFLAKAIGCSCIELETYISELDLIKAYPKNEIQTCIESLVDHKVDCDNLDVDDIHSNLLGYKLFTLIQKK